MSRSVAVPVIVAVTNALVALVVLSIFFTGVREIRAIPHVLFIALSQLISVFALLPLSILNVFKETGKLRILNVMAAVGCLSPWLLGTSLLQMLPQYGIELVD